MPGLAWRKSTLRAGTCASFIPCTPSLLKLLEQTKVEIRKRRQDHVGGLQAAVVCQRRVGYGDTAHAGCLGGDHPMGGVLEGQASPGRDVQASSRLDVDARVRFAVRLVLGRLRHLKIGSNAEGIQ